MGLYPCCFPFVKTGLIPFYIIKTT